MIKIRPYNNKDKDNVINLIKEVLFEIFGAEPKNIDDLKNIEKEYFKNGGTFLIAEVNEKIVGTIAIKKEKNKVARLKRMFVDQKYRRQKIGQKLLDEILKFCKDKGYEKIILSTYPQMKAAIKFYKREGFKKYKKTSKRIFFEKNLKVPGGN